jgi:hypothetical protein
MKQGIKKPKTPIKKLINKNNTLCGCLLNIFAPQEAERVFALAQSNNSYVFPRITRFFELYANIIILPIDIEKGSLLKGEWLSRYAMEFL